MSAQLVPLCFRSFHAQASNNTPQGELHTAIPRYQPNVSRQQQQGLHLSSSAVGLKLCDQSGKALRDQPGCLLSNCRVRRPPRRARTRAPAGTICKRIIPVLALREVLRRFAAVATARQSSATAFVPDFALPTVHCPFRYLCR